MGEILIGYANKKPIFYRPKKYDVVVYGTGIHIENMSTLGEAIETCRAYIVGFKVDKKIKELVNG